MRLRRRLARTLRSLWTAGLPAWFLLLALALAGAPPAAAQQDAAALYHSATEPDVPEKAGKLLFAHRLLGDAPLIDGALDEAAWTEADSATGMMQWDPDNGLEMTERTVVRILYDARYLYIGVRLYDRDADAIVQGLGRRDRPPPSDDFQVGFDTQHDHLTGYMFATNPSGVQLESYYYDDTANDVEYNAVWEVETQVGLDGWTAEYRIPFSQMRFSAPLDGGAVWGLDFRRLIHRKNESGQWVARPRGATGQVSRWGHLVFEDGIAPARRIEALPFVVTRGDRPSGGSFDDGYDAGLDVRMGLGRSATLAATFNPDFGQVEADPAVLNLSVFETFFPEKRPFFLADGNVFVPAYGLFQLFHSRRIGGRPGYLRPFEPGDVVLERPDQTTILGAAKVTGKDGGYTYGAVTALTSPEHALVRVGGPDGAGAAHVERLIEPTTSYSAARVQRDLGTGSSVSALGTAVVREGAPDAFAAGVDWRVRWSQNRWQWNGHWAGSNAPLAGERVSGIGGLSNLSFNSRNWNANTHFHHIGSDFRINDIGFLRARPGETQVTANGGFTDPDPGRVLRRWNVGANAGRSWNPDGLRVGEWTNVYGGGQLLSFWGFNGNVGYSPEVYDDLDTRGGPPILRPSDLWGSVGVNSDPRRPWTLFLGAFGNRTADGGFGRGGDVSLDLQPSPRLQLSVAAGYNGGVNTAQWITNRDVDGDGAIDHVYGRLESDVVNLTLRASAAVNRDLTLEGFLQPFVAVGDYTELKRLARPSSFDFEPIVQSAVGDPDFNTKSLRGTFVLRWEYVRGSTVFLAWNFSGGDEARPGLFRPWQDLQGAFGAPLDNRLALKVNYWFSL